MKKIVSLTELELHRIINETISDILNKKYLYHTIKSLEDLPNILKNGLRTPNDREMLNWDGIFLCDNKSYNGRCTALLGIELNNRNIEKYNIAYSKGVSIAHTQQIEPSDIELVDCRIGEGSDPEYLMASVWLEQGVLNEPIESIAEVCNSFMHVEMFYEDVCEYFFGVESTRKLKQLNIPFRKLGI